MNPKRWEKIGASVEFIDTVLDSINKDKAAAKYGPGAIAQRRDEALVKWEPNFLQYLQEARADALAAKEKAAAISAKVRQMVDTGRGPRKQAPIGNPPDGLYGSDGDAWKEGERRHIQTQAELRDIAARVRLAAELHTLPHLSTEALAGILEGFMEAAKSAPEFDYRAYAALRRVVPDLLNQRGEKGDTLARVALDKFSTRAIEAELAFRAGAADDGESDLREIATVFDAMRFGYDQVKSSVDPIMRRVALAEQAGQGDPAPAGLPVQSE